jgi:hypothetical protein
MNQLMMMPGHLKFPATIDTKLLLNYIAGRMGGYIFRSTSASPLAVTVGGVVIGMMFNMTQPINLDAGHCVYILPGSMETRFGGLRRD